MNAENLTQSQFADSIGVARASISHILSGRNKPGFDFIENIARKYPNLNLEWLITGKGKMYGSPIVEQVAATPPVIKTKPGTNAIINDDNLFPDDDLFASSAPGPNIVNNAGFEAITQTQMSTPAQAPASAVPQTPAQSPVSTPFPVQESAPVAPASTTPRMSQLSSQVPASSPIPNGKKLIEQIIIFYQDGTFSKVY